MNCSKIVKSAALALVCLAHPLCTNAQQFKNPKWLDNAVFYQIYPSSFQDTDGNGIGDIPGIISRLDYIKDLGVNALWLNPVFVSGFTDGGYDVIDFYRVDPRFGTNNDLVQLTQEAHKRGIKVCLDLVAGHTSDQCIWFQQSQQDSNLQYSDYYIWMNELPASEQNNVVTLAQPDDPDMLDKRFVETRAPRARYFEKNYFLTQPALNYGYAHPDPSHPWEQRTDAPGPQAVRREMRCIMQFWFEKGVDGFRVDMAHSVIKNDPDKKAVVALWQEMRQWMDANFPECILMSEWCDPEKSSAAGFHVDFMIEFGVPGYGSMFFDHGTHPKNWDPADFGLYEVPYFHRSGKGNYQLFMHNWHPLYQKTKGKSMICVPTGNHDMQRPHAFSRQTMEELKVAMTFYCLMPGAPVIYYGDEIGMKYQEGLPSKEGSDFRAGSRTPMQWTREAKAGFSTAELSRFYLPVDTEDGLLTVEAQQNDPNSLLNYTKQLLALRHDHAALGNTGEWELLSNPDQPYPMVYRRYAGNESFIVVLNPSDKAVTTTIPAQQGQAEQVIGSAKQGSYIVGKDRDKLKIKPVSALVYRMVQ